MEAKLEQPRSASISMYIFAIIALLSSMAMGCATGWCAPSLESLTRNGSVPQLDKTGDEEIKSWIGSSMTLGALSGSLLSGLITKFISRRNAIIGLAIPYLSGWAMIAFGKTVEVIIAGRVVTGLGVGICCSVSPSYVSDIVTPKSRGKLGALFQILNCIGLLYVASFGHFLEWNQLSYPAAIPVVLCTVGMLFAPESPISLVESGQIEEAEKVLSRLRTANSDVKIELAELQDRVQQLRSRPSVSIWSLLKRADVYNPAIIAIMLMLFQQLSGITGVIYNMVSIFDKANVPLNPLVATQLVDVILVVATGAGAVLMDRFGRKILLIVSGAGDLLSLGIMALYYYSITPNLTWIPVACMMAFMVFFSLGYGPIPWMIISELTPNEALNQITAVGTAVNWLTAFLISKFFIQMTEMFNEYGTYFIFAALSLLSVIYTSIFVPETKHRPIEEIQKHFLKKA